MQNLMALPDVLPHAPGTGPFHVRGVVYVRTLEHSKQVPGGLDAVFSHIRDESIRTFVRGRFPWMGWNDAGPLVFLQMALARAEQRSFEDAIQARSKESAHALIPGMFRGIVRLGRPQAAAQHLPRLIGGYFDFGRLTLERAEQRTLQASVAHVPQFLAASFANVLLGVVDGFLEAMGVVELHSRVEGVQHDESVKEYPAVMFRIVYEWA